MMVYGQLIAYIFEKVVSFKLYGTNVQPISESRLFCVKVKKMHIGVRIISCAKACSIL